MDEQRQQQLAAAESAAGAFSFYHQRRQAAADGRRRRRQQQGSSVSVENCIFIKFCIFLWTHFQKLKIKFKFFGTFLLTDLKSLFFVDCKDGGRF